jgi:hypothetical protein
MIYYGLTGFSSQRLLVRMNESQNLVALNEETGKEEVVTPFETGDNWWDTNRGCETQARASKNRATHEGPSGSWNSVLPIEFRKFSCADVGVESEQYAENIGMLRRVNTTFAGPVTYDLIYAHVGNQVIEAGERGRFSVAVMADPAAKVWHATLRTDLGNAGGISLRFNSGQEYDLALRNSDGYVVWTWSMDKLFIAAQHSRTFNSNWSATVDVPMPTGVIPGAEYTIEAWLSAAEGQPRFAATAQVYLPRPASAAALRR